MLRLPLQPPDATQLSAWLELQLKVVDCPRLMPAEDTDRVAIGTVSSDGSDTGSGVALGTTPVPRSVVASVRFSSLLHAVSTTEMNKRERLLENTG